MLRPVQILAALSLEATAALTRMVVEGKVRPILGTSVSGGSSCPPARLVAERLMSSSCHCCLSHLTFLPSMVSAFPTMKGGPERGWVCPTTTIPTPRKLRAADNPRQIPVLLGTRCNPGTMMPPSNPAWSTAEHLVCEALQIGFTHPTTAMWPPPPSHRLPESPIRVLAEREFQRSMPS